MEFGSLELQIVMSLLVVLGVAFVALICDLLKGNNEMLRERNAELRARLNERDRISEIQPEGLLQNLAALVRNPQIAGALAAATPAGSLPGSDVLHDEAALESNGEEMASITLGPPPVVRRKMYDEAKAQPKTAAWASKEELEQLAGRAARIRARQEAAQRGAEAPSAPPSPAAMPEAPFEETSAPEPPVLAPSLSVVAGREVQPPELPRVQAEPRFQQPEAIQPVFDEAEPVQEIRPSETKVEGPKVEAETKRPSPADDGLEAWLASRLAERPEQTAPAPVSATPQEAAVKTPRLPNDDAVLSLLEPAVAAPSDTPRRDWGSAPSAVAEPVAAPKVDDENSRWIFAPHAPEPEPPIPMAPLQAESASSVPAAAEAEYRTDDGRSIWLEQPLDQPMVAQQAEPSKPEPRNAKVVPFDLAADRTDLREELDLQDELQRVANLEAAAPVQSRAAQAPPTTPLDIGLPEPAALPSIPANGLRIPPGLQDSSVLSKLIESPEPYSGVVVAIGINDFDSVRDKLNTSPSNDYITALNKMVLSMLRPEDFASRFVDDEYILLYPGESGASAQRRLFQVSEKLWDFQLRSLGHLSVMFSWGGLEVQEETLAEAVASARERMYQTRRNRKSSSEIGFGRKRVVNG